MNGKSQSVHIKDSRGFYHPTKGKHEYLSIDCIVELTQVPTQSFQEFTCYEVAIAGKIIGLVMSFETRSYRKAGRLISRTFTPKRWTYSVPNQLPDYRIRSYNRAAAICDLILAQHIISLQGAK